MPTLNWIGKEAVVDHHRRVPLRLLECDPKLSAGDPQAGNLLIHGDNLEALKALLPRYKGQVKCIYIDPPYNTGNEGWIYNDNVNDPRIKKWLGDVVGKEAEDLCRHDKWLCMMYPRLALLKEFLSEDGAIFISIDDNEVAGLRLIMNEILGDSNFVATVIWQKMFSPKNSARQLSESHDYIAIFARDTARWTPYLISRAAEQNDRYKNPDDDPRGPWTSGDLSARNYYGAGTYSITTPSGRVISGPPRGMYWRVSEPALRELIADNRIWFGKTGGNVPRLKRFLTDVRDGVVPQTLWPHTDVGNTQEAKKDLLAVVEFSDSESVFITPKPIRLVRRILELSSSASSLILDSFAGSGTTGHAVLQMNKADGGNRKFILVEVDDNIAQNVTAQRLRKVVEGYTNNEGEPVEGFGGGFRFCRLGKTLLDEQGEINPGVPFVDLARYVYLIETGMPVPTRPRKDSPLLGVHEGRAIYLLYNGVLGDKRPAGGNVLTHAVLGAIPPNPQGAGGARVVFGEACRLSETTLQRLNVTFRQTPYALREE